MDIMEELKKFLIGEFGADFNRDSIDPDENLLMRGAIDSMGIIKLVSFMENKFGIKIDNEDIVPDNFQTLRSLTEFIEKKAK
jgi:acyl carrier protein